MWGQRYELSLETKRQTKIANEVFWGSKIVGFDRALADLAKHYLAPPNRVRALGFVPTYNCHGLTFASRRTWIAPEELPQILKNDGYIRLPEGDVLPGDAIVYYGSEGVEHSGLVIRVGEGERLVLSKFGQLHEVIHVESRLPPDYQAIIKKEFWRVVE